MSFREFLWTISPYHRIKEWWRLRLFREYQRGWIAASKDPQADLKIPMPFTYKVISGPIATTQEVGPPKRKYPGGLTGWGF